MSSETLAAVAEYTSIPASVEAMASNLRQTIRKHSVITKSLAKVSWLSAVWECGCLVTRVPSSVELYLQEVRSLPGSPTLRDSSDKSSDFTSWEEQWPRLKNPPPNPTLVPAAAEELPLEHASGPPLELLVEPVLCPPPESVLFHLYTFFIFYFSLCSLWCDLLLQFIFNYK